ncbi:putative F-box protein At1g65770 [Triticum urartu]|uniref:KIB1-4 beta-propeller domain-containing protein n=1 Tax=Triticum urartu TaxID=4572 RepID=A0A8R7Q2L0_TRIUA|nr:putative F-box protein At1g65770 [Triticum urartu]
MADWAGLHEDFLLLLVPRLPSLDLRTFRTVCASWRAAAATFASAGGRPRPDRPWLLLPADAPDPEFRRLAICRDQEVPVVTLPARLGRAHDRRLFPLGSSRGVIVAADDRGAMHLLDLATGRRAPLPPVAALPLADRVERTPAGLSVRLKRDPRVYSIDGLIHRDDTLIHKAVAVPTPGGGAMVIVIYSPHSHRHQWATARPGDSTWKSVKPSSIPAVVDLALHRGQLYANTLFGMVYVYPELHGLGSASPDIIPSETRRPTSRVESSFLVQTPGGGALMQVERVNPVPPAESEEFVAPAEGEEFVVRVLDECGGTWEEEEDIGDVALLVDASGAVAVSTRECPGLRPSTIYYADLNGGETRVRAYSLAGKHKKVEVVESLPGAEGNKWPCFWFTPVYSQ